MGVVKYNFKDFDDCINKTQTSKRYIDQAENIVEAVYGPLDWRIASQNGKTYSKIVDKMTDMEEDISKVINYCKSILSEYEKMEAKINKELSNLQSKSLKISKLLSTSLFDVGTAIYEKAKIEAKENPKKETPPKEETKKKKKKQNFLQRSWNSATKKVKSIGDSVADTACDFGEWMIYEPVGEKWKDIKHIGNGIGKDLKSAGETAVEVGRRGVLTGCNACSGFTWGLADFTEGLYDGLTYIGTGLLTPVTGLVDGGQAIGCLISGNKYDSITVNMWQGASESVKTDIAGYQKEKYYKKNGYGDLLKEDSYAYEAVNKTSETVGYISGAIMTGGAGIQIGTASMAISGIGNGSEDALKSGATIGESIISGAVQGIIDGASYLFGAKLGQKVFGQGSTKFDKVWTKIFGDTATVKSNVANVAIKSGADMADGAINTLAQPTIQKIYRDESYGELFQQNGGYTALFTNMAIAGGLSAASEGLEIKSKSKNMETPTEQSIPKNTAPTKDIDAQIESVNYYAKKGMFSSINLNSLDDISLNDLNKIDDIDNVLFKLPDGATYNYKVNEIKINNTELPESNTSIKDSTRNIDEQIGVISETEKIDVLNTFQDLMLRDKNNDQQVVDIMYMAFKSAMDNGNLESFGVLKTFIKLKKDNPDLKVILGSSSFWHNASSTIVLDAKCVTLNDYGTLCHELGHCLYDNVLSGILPGDWYEICARAKEISSNSYKMSNFIDEQNQIVEKLHNTATNIFEEYLNNRYGLTIAEYEKYLTHKYSQLLKESTGNQLDIKLKQMGYNTDIITKVYAGAIDASDLSIVEIKGEIYSILEQLRIIQNVNNDAISDIIDAVYDGVKRDLNGNELKLVFGHGSEYYAKRNVPNSTFHEIIANFTQLKISCDEKSLNTVKNIFGDEFYNLLDAVFLKFCYNK